MRSGGGRVELLSALENARRVSERADSLNQTRADECTWPQPDAPGLRTDRHDFASPVREPRAGADRVVIRIRTADPRSQSEHSIWPEGASQGARQALRGPLAEVKAFDLTCAWPFVVISMTFKFFVKCKLFTTVSDPTTSVPQGGASCGAAASGCGMVRSCGRLRGAASHADRIGISCERQTHP